MTKDQIRAIFLAHGFTVKEGQPDLKQYVYDAADALLRQYEEIRAHDRAERVEPADGDRWRFVLEQALAKWPQAADLGDEFDITYVPAGQNGSKWSRIEIEWAHPKWQHVTAEQINAIVDAARSRVAPTTTQGGAAPTKDKP